MKPLKYRGSDIFSYLVLVLFFAVIIGLNQVDITGLLAGLPGFKS
jgi:hypothetical protein